MPARAARYRSLEPSIDASVVIAVTALELANGLAELSAGGGWGGEGSKRRKGWMMEVAWTVTVVARRGEGFKG